VRVLTDSLRVRDAPRAGAVTVSACAAQLGAKASRVKYWIALGAPVVRRGRKGAGNSTLIDPQALLAWMNARGRSSAEKNRELASKFTQSLATTMCLQWRSFAGPEKLQRAGMVVETFLMAAQTIRAQLGLPDMRPDEVPEEIQQMQKVAAFLE
jgi:hypothetical protein